MVRVRFLGGFELPLEVVLLLGRADPAAGIALSGEATRTGSSRDWFDKGAFEESRMVTSCADRLNSSFSLPSSQGLDGDSELPGDDCGSVKSVIH